MQQHGDENALAQKAVAQEPFALALGALGLAEVDAHVDRKEEMPRDGEQRTRHRDGQTELRDIEDVFQRGEAQRGEDAIDHGVEPVVEGGMFPREAAHRPVLAKLLDKGDGDEVLQQEIAQLAAGIIPVQQARQNSFDEARCDAGQCADDHQLHQQRARLLFDLIELIDADEQDDGRQQRGQKQDRVHNGLRFKAMGRTV